MNPVKALLSFCVTTSVALFLSGSALRAQTNYEIQVYGAETVKPGNTMVELHSNFTFSGSKTVVDGVMPTQHSFHETIEITQGINDWFETGFYIFTAESTRFGTQWVGDHIRPRFRVPENWHWPVGVSVSNEIGYTRRAYSTDTWTWEIRPIIDKQQGRLYWAFNPALERSWHGDSVNQGVVFAPAFKIGWDFTKKVNAGFEYYGSQGPITGFDALKDQEQQFFPCVDLNLSEAWEFNFGMGVGVTRSTDHLIVKMIIGRRFDFSRHKGKTTP
jgi:hypothetical protein